MNKKYEFTGETKEHLGQTLYRIRRLSDGLLGGWIEKESNLSHEGECWVYEDAKVFGNAKVYGNARVYGIAEVYGRTRVFGNAMVFGNADVYGNSMVYGSAEVYGSAKVYGSAWVYGDAVVCGSAWVYGNARVSGEAEVFGGAKVSGDAVVYGDAEVYGNAEVGGDSVCTKKVVSLIINPHDVTVTDNNIHIGCKTFKIEDFKNNKDKLIEVAKKYNYSELDIKRHAQIIEALLIGW